MNYSLSYTNEKTNNLHSINTRKICQKSNSTIYHAKFNNKNVNSIKVYNNSDKKSEILYNNGSIVETRLHNIRKMRYEYEQYIFSRGFYSTHIKIGFSGCVNRFHNCPSRLIEVQVDNTIISGDSYNANDIWEWETEKSPDSVSTYINTGMFADSLGTDKCVIVGSEDPIKEVSFTTKSNKK